MFKSLIAALLLTLPAFVRADDIGLLLMRVDVSLVTDVEHESFSSGNHTRGFWVTNLATRKSYGDSLSDGLKILEVPEGIYCLATIDVYPVEQASIDYCGEPYIKVVKGQMNNAGTWRFGMSYSHERWKLWRTMSNLQETAQAAARKYPQYFVDDTAPAKK